MALSFISHFLYFGTATGLAIISPEYLPLMSGKSVLIVLPNKDFDVTETSVPWRLLTNVGVQVDFCTGHGLPGECDPLLLSGVIFGQLGAAAEAKKFYNDMVTSKEFQSPKKYSEVDFMEYDGLILPGGHAQGMKQYLEDTDIRSKLVPFISNSKKTVGAICHGTVVLARTIDPSTGHSLLFHRNSTCLPKYMEKTAYFMTAWKLGRYYRTYDIYVEDEIKQAMSNPKEQFQPGICNTFGSLDEKYASVSISENYVSARWPGDAYLFARTILQKINQI